MFMGLIVLSLPITIIGANFDELYREMRRKEQVEKARLPPLPAILFAHLGLRPVTLAGHPSGSTPAVLVPRYRRGRSSNPSKCPNRPARRVSRGLPALSAGE